MAGTLAINNIQLGDSLTASQNFVLKTNSDGTATLARGNVGSTSQDILTIGVDGKVIITQGVGQSLLVSGTALPATGTFVDFTGIPSWVKRITIMFNGVSINGATQIGIELGDSEGIETTGYFSTGSAIQGSAVGTNGIASKFILSNNDGAAGWVRRGRAVLEKLGGTTWVLSSSLSVSGAPSDRCEFGSGSKTLSGQLTTIRFGSANGTSAFTAGTINILYE